MKNELIIQSGMNVTPDTLKLSELIALECIENCVTVLHKEYFAPGSTGSVIQEQIVMDCISAIKETFGV
jgi:hypothetical protein